VFSIVDVDGFCGCSNFGNFPSRSVGLKKFEMELEVLLLTDFFFTRFLVSNPVGIVH